MVTLQDEVISSRQLVYDKEAEIHKLQTKVSTCNQYILHV